MINRHKGQIRVGQSGPIVVGNLPPEQSFIPKTVRQQEPSVIKQDLKQDFGYMMIEKFNTLVYDNKVSRKPWYYGLEGTWWWGMTEENARRKIIEEEDMTYAHPNVAIAVPHIQPKIGSSSKIAYSRQVTPLSQPIVISKIIEDGPKIAIASIVRNEERSGNLGRFLDCCQDLEQYHKNLVYIFIEGDSSDRTYHVLKDWIIQQNNYILEKIDGGCAPFGKSKDIRRTNYLAKLRNRLTELVLSIPEVTEILVIDANYGWKGDLIKSLRETNADIAAPLAVAHKHNNGRYIFYDIWAFRKNGKNFGPFYPYIKGIESNNPTDIDSAGGGYLIKRQVLDAGVRYSGGDCEHVNFCRKAREKGFSIKINPRTYIRKGGYKE